jgi:hypothetical protein
MRETTKYAYRRTWKQYNKERLIHMLSDVDWNIEEDTVQGFWNTFENKLINIVDTIIPMKIEANNIKI